MSSVRQVPMIGQRALVIRIRKLLKSNSAEWQAQAAELLITCASAFNVAVRRDTRLKQISEHCCSRCDYDEAEGGLVNHCDECCRKITTELWKLVHEGPT